MQSFKAMLLAALLSLSTTPAFALVLPEIAEMAPHRAVYDITLGDAKASAGISDVKGRLVFEFTGSPCEGYSQTLRFVMSITDREGTTTLSDLRSTTWEDAESKSFKFDIENIENQETKEAATGTATRDATGGIKVKLSNASKPASTEVSFPGPVLFPLQHTATLLAAAKRGEHRVDVGVFDGSELGQQVFTTGTAIGKSAVGDETELAGVANTERLQHQPSWPMTVAYFPPVTAGAGESTPEHEMSFRLYANGVIRSVKIDYGTLRLDGRLSKIEFLDQRKCGS